MRRFFALLVSLACLFGFTLPARAQSVVDISGVGVTTHLGIRLLSRPKIPDPILQSRPLTWLFPGAGDQNTRTIH